MVEIVGGRGPADVVGRSMGDFFENESERDSLIAELIETGRIQEVEIRARRLDDRRVLIRGGGRLVRDAEGTPIASEWFAEDVTERRHLEARLLQAQKMEAIGRLAGGVAHDFNNLLTVILGCSVSLGERSTSQADLDELAEIRRASERAQSLTSQLLAFSRKQLLEPRVVDLNHVVGEARRMLDRVIGENIEIEVDLDVEPVTVRADPAQLEQVLFNLAANARDAMPRGGVIRFRTSTDGDSHAPPNDGPPTDRVLLEMRPVDGNGEVILLIEDDDAVRSLVRRYLGGRGYQVIAAGSGAEALTMAADFEGVIDLLLTDVVLPDLTPLEIRARLEVARPGIPAILMSGYATDVLASHGGIPEGTDFIAKPFDPVDLLALVGQALRRAAA